MTMIIAIVIDLLSGTKVIVFDNFRTPRPRKQKLRKNFFLLIGIYRDGGIGVSQKMRKRM